MPFSRCFRVVVVRYVSQQKIFPFPWFLSSPLGWVPCQRKRFHFSLVDFFVFLLISLILRNQKKINSRSWVREFYYIFFLMSLISHKKFPKLVWNQRLVEGETIDYIYRNFLFFFFSFRFLTVALLSSVMVTSLTNPDDGFFFRFSQCDMNLFFTPSIGNLRLACVLLRLLNHS